MASSFCRCARELSAKERPSSVFKLKPRSGRASFSIPFCVSQSLALVYNQGRRFHGVMTAIERILGSCPDAQSHSLLVASKSLHFQSTILISSNNTTDEMLMLRKNCTTNEVTDRTSVREECREGRLAQHLGWLFCCCDEHHDQGSIQKLLFGLTVLGGQNPPYWLGQRQAAGRQACLELDAESSHPETLSYCSTTMPNLLPRSPT